MHVTVCAATFRRPELLAAMLASIEAQRLEEYSSARVTVIVVDNDDEESARPVVMEVGAKSRYTVRYVAEPRRGIAHARNTAIAAALAEDADFIVLIDDDETAREDWLVHLLRTQMKFGVEAVYGPVVSRFENAPPAWVTDGGFFDRSVVPTGERVPIGATGNVLLTRRLLERRVPPFDTRFGLTGGEDTHFFLGLRNEGIPVISCAEAVVVETVPPQRATARYLLQRAFASGASFVAAEQCFASGRAWTIRRLSIALARMAGGLLTTVVRGPFGGHHAIRGLQRFALGLGMLAGVRGIRFEHYRSTTGA